MSSNADKKSRRILNPSAYEYQYRNNSAAKSPSHLEQQKASTSTISLQDTLAKVCEKVQKQLITYKKEPSPNKLKFQSEPASPKQLKHSSTVTKVSNKSTPKTRPYLTSERTSKQLQGPVQLHNYSRDPQIYNEQPHNLQQEQSLDQPRDSHGSLSAARRGKLARASDRFKDSFSAELYRSASGAPGSQSNYNSVPGAPLAPGVDSQELQIENDRLKTTIMIITQKLKLKEDDNRTLIDRMKTEIVNLQAQNRHLDKQNQ